MDGGIQRWANPTSSVIQYWDADYKDKVSDVDMTNSVRVVDMATAADAGYYQHEVENRPLKEIILEVRRKLVEATRLRLRADVPVGIYLSGGIDSSTVAGIVTHLAREEGVRLGNEHVRKRIKCFTVQFGESSGFNEAGESSSSVAK